MKKAAILFFNLFLFGFVQAQLVDHQVINHAYFELAVNSGHVEYFDDLGLDPDDDVFTSFPIDISQLTNSANYLLSSSQDANYSTPQNPAALGRFSKGIQFMGPYNFPINVQHRMFLQWPFDLQEGSTYSLSISNNSGLTDPIEFQFDPDNQVSSAVHVNNIGYLPDATAKYGYVGSWLGDLGGLELNGYTGQSFNLVDDATGLSVYSGTMTERRDLQTSAFENAFQDEYYGADVWECDFSSFQQEGTYRLVVDGFGSSTAFRIAEDAYKDIFYDVSRSLYHQRCGVELTSEYTNFERPLCHHPSIPGYTPTYSNVLYQNFLDAPFQELIDNDTGTPMPNAFRHYHDAADWDSRSDHLIICYYLQTLYEMKPNAFYDGQMDIPESGNGIPDILDESKFGLDTYRRLLGPTGGVCGGIEEETHPIPGDASYTDDLQWFTFAEEPKATFQTVAALAHYAFMMASINVNDSVSAYTSEAEGLYTWAENNIAAGDEAIVFEARILAAAMLFKLTGNSNFGDDYVNLYNQFANNITYPENSDYLHLAIYHYNTSTNGTPDASMAAAGLSDLTGWSNFTSLPANDRAFRWANNPYRPMRYGTASTPYVIQLVLMHELTGDADYRKMANTTLDYYLGNNMDNRTWVTGHGAKPPSEILLLDSWVDGIKSLIPGFIVYGTSHEPQDFGWYTFDGHGYTDAYPAMADIPLDYAYMENRYCPKTAEFTVHETNAPWVFALGYFMDDNPTITSTAPDVLVDDDYIELFPNPNNGYFTVKGKLQNYTLTIMDEQGSIYGTYAIASFSKTFELADLPTGMYFILVQSLDEQQLTLQKIIKM